jgi:guanylate kinase
MQTNTLHPIVAFVGPSGAGKTEIMRSIVRHDPEHYGFLPGFMTRHLRPGEEDMNLEVILPAVGKQSYEAFTRGETGVFANVAEYAGTYYGNVREVVNDFLVERTALKDLVPEGILNFRRAGYNVEVIVVIPLGHTPRLGREKADQEAARHYTALEPVLGVVNDHNDPEGLQKAIDKVIRYLSN